MSPLTPRHHPGEDLLLRLAAGRLSAGEALVVSAHLEGCGACRARLHALQAIGGVLLEQAEPTMLDPGAWTRTLELIDAPGVGSRHVASGPTSDTTPAPQGSLQLPAGTPWPRSLRRCAVSPWRWVGPGLRLARISVPFDPSASLFLLRINRGRSLPLHTHGEIELTQVLCGAFDDGRATFAAGDFDAADADVHHRPTVGSGGDCVCLAYVSAPLAFEGPIASIVGRWIGM